MKNDSKIFEKIKNKFSIFIMLVFVLCAFLAFPNVTKADDTDLSEYCKNVPEAEDAANPKAYEICYKPADENWSVDNVNDALDGLYLMTIEDKCIETLEITTATNTPFTFNATGKTEITEFNPLITEYDLTLETFEQYFTVTGTLFEDTSIVSGLDQEYYVEYGKTTVVDIIVTTISGEIRHYTINATRAPLVGDSNKLSVLRVEGYKYVDPIDYEQSIRFAPLINEYGINLLEGEYYVDVTAAAFDPDATITITGNELMLGASGTITVTVHEPNIAEDEVYTISFIRNNQSSLDGFSYTGEYQEFVANHSGKYKVELWGAQGGAGGSQGGAGAYTSGYINLKIDDKLYVYVGERPTGTAASWNGGGTSTIAAGAGGGATDVRLVPGTSKTEWNNAKSLASRIMVAGAGGGGGTTADNAGGALRGLYVNESYHGTGGTQVGGGIAGTSSNGTAFDGEFGKGGNAGTNGTGGGAGYWGGAGSIKGTANGLGGGGSSYISGYTGSVAITAEDDITPKSIDGVQCATGTDNNDCSIHYSKKVFQDGVMIDGASEMPSHDGTTTITGNTGHGYAKITFEDLNRNNYLRELKTDVGNVDGDKLEDVFDTTTYDYYVTLTDLEEEVEISGRPHNSSATIDGLGVHHIPADVNNDPEGRTSVPITVTAESGDIRIYTIHFIRPANSNGLPNNITISGLIPSYCEIDDSYCKIEPETFSTDNVTYDMTIPYKIREIQFNVEKGHYFQNVSGDGKVSVLPNANLFTVTVTSEDGANSSFYNYRIIRDMTGDNDLLKLSVLHPEVTLNFDPEITEYYYSVGNAIDKYVVNNTEEINSELQDTMQLYYETDDTNAQAYMLGDGILRVGQNTIPIMIIAQNGETQTYTLNVYRAPNSDTFLSELAVKSLDEVTTYDLTPEFNYLNFGTYKVTVGKDVEQVKLIATPNSPTTTVTGGGTLSLNKGNNYFEIKTKSESNDEETYKINIFREKDNNANLAELRVLIDGVNTYYTPEFDPDTLEYEINAPIGASEVSYDLVLESDVATSQLLDNNAIKVGVNSKRILVRAEDNTTKTYTITINRPADTNNKLGTLRVSNDSEEFTLNPVFDPLSDVDHYELTVDNDVSWVNVAGTPASSYATITGNRKYSLSVGVNEIIIKVKSESKAEKTYQIDITRLPNSNAYLKAITTTAGVLVPEFDKENNTYSINVDSETSEITIVGTPEVTTTRVTGNQKYDLEPGLNTIELTTLAQDNVTSLTYTIEVTRDRSANANLSNLFIKEGKLSPTFDKNIIEYTTRIPYELNNVNVVYETEQEGATVAVSGNTHLVVGENTVTVKVTAADSTEKIYNIRVIRQEESEYSTYLSSLSINNGELDPTFTKTNQYYEVEVAYGVTQITLNGVAEDENARVEGNATYDLHTGANLLNVRVVGQDDKIRDYMVLVNRAKNDEARLSNVAIKNQSINFDKGTYSYNITTKENSLEFTNITKMDNNATYVISGNSFEEVGNYTVKITVTAENNVATKEYTFNVTREESNNANLSKLEVEGYTITPVFNKNTTNYNLTVQIPNDITSVNIIADTEEKHATITGDGIRDLSTGENLVNVVVTSEDNTTKTYTIRITRKKSENNNINVFEVLNGTLNREYADNVNLYNVEVPYEETELDLNIILADESASYNVSGNANFKVGNNNTVRVVVTAESGKTRTITLNVTRQEAISGLLTELKVDDYDLLPEFESTTFNYNIIVNNETTSLNIHPTMLDRLGTYTISGNENFNVGNNTITINTSSRDDSKHEVYTLTVTRQAYVNNYLRTLTVSEGSLDPTFNQTTLTYNVSVASDVDKITIDGEVDDTTSTATGFGEKDLEVGENEFTISVVNLGIRRNYKVNVTRAKANDNYLLSLVAKVNNEEQTITPEFDSKTNEYTINVAPSTKVINFTGTVSSGATATGLGNRNLVLGNNELDIVVKSLSGEERTYTINVYRPASSDAEVLNIIPSSGTLNPAFDPLTSTYDLEVASNVDKLSFNVSTSNEFASVSGNEELDLAVGSSQRIITTTAEDDVNSTQYTINITRARTDNADLASLEVDGYSFDETFDPGLQTYNIHVGNEKESIDPVEVIAISSDPNAKVTKQVQTSLIGKNSVEYLVTVKSYDESATKIYKIIVNRSTSNDAGVTLITPSSGSLDPVFDSSTKTYNLRVASNVTLLSFDVTTTNKFATVEGNEEAYVAVGSSQRVITITSEDTSESEEYTINIVRDRTDNALLDNLYIEGYSFTETFDPNTFEYSVTVDNSKASLSPSDVIAVASDANATITKQETTQLSTKNVTDYLVTVKSYDESATKVYTIKVTREKSDLIQLDSLTANKGRLSPAFTPSTKEYDLYLYEDEPNVVINAIPSSDDITIISGTGTITLTEENTENRIILQAEDSSTGYYTVNIHRTIKKDKGLQDLGLNYDSELETIPSEFVLSPEFNTDKSNYTIKVPYEYYTLDVAYTLTNDQQSVKIKVGGSEVNNYQLPIGNTTVDIEVYDGFNILTKTYHLTITKSRSRNTYLSNLAVNGYQISPEFNKHTQEYYMNIPLNVTDLDLEDIIATPEDPQSRVVINGYTYLMEGYNDLTVEVISDGRATREYIVHIYKGENKASDLKNITVSTGTFWDLSPKFVPNVYEYSVVVPGIYDKATVEGVAENSELVTIDGNGEYDLRVGNNLVTITSTSESGQISIYKVNIIKEVDEDVDLISLSASEGSISPTFDRSTTKYTMSVGEDVEKLTLTYKTSNSTARVFVAGNQNFVSGDNKVNIVVTNAEGTKTKTYQIIVKKDKSSNPLLSSLQVIQKVEDDDDIEYPLTPEFNTNNHSYSVDVGEDVDKVNIVAKAVSSTATILGAGDNYLNYGNNRITISTIAENGNTDSYIINIYRNYNLNLENITISDGELEPAFNPGITSYTVSVPYSTDKITILGTPETNKVTVTGNNTYSLGVEDNNISLVVTAPDNRTRTYMVNVVREKDDNNYIKELQVDGIISPTFDKLTTTYNVDVRPNVKTLDINVELESPNATYEVLNNSNLSDTTNPNEVIIRVRAQNGNERDYKLNVMVRDWDYFSNRLRDLQVNQGQLTPDFNSDINNYAVSVENSIDEIEVTAIKQNSNQKVEINGINGATQKVSLNVGRNIINIAVTDQFNIGTSYYSLIVYRLEATDASLSNLVVQGQNFSPLFNRNRYEYNLTIGSEVENLNVIATPQDPNSRVEIDGNTNIASGESQIRIKVTAPDNVHTKEYVINVNKLKSTNNYLVDIDVKDFDLNETFTKTNQGIYTLYVPYETANIMVTGVPEVKTTTVTGDGLISLNKGVNIITLIATAESGDTRTYTLAVTRAYNHDSSLSDIVISDGELTPVFNKATLTYEVEVEEEVEEVDIKGIPTDINAKVVGNGTYDLTENEETTIDLVVTAENNVDKTTYKVKFIRRIPASSYLSKLVIKDGELYPNFHKLITSYTILVPNEVRSLNMIYNPEDELANVEVTGNSSFKVGSNKVHIIVTAADNSSTTDYEINVIRQSKASNYLKYLMVKSGDGSKEFDLTPVFNKDTMYYEVMVPKDTETINIMAEAEDITSSLSATQLGIKSIYNKENRYYVTVEAESGAIRSYQLVVIKQEAPNRLLSLTSDKGSLSPEFDPDTNNYVLTVGTDVNKVNLNGTISDGATVEGLGEVNLNDDTTEHQITVTKDDKDNVYTITIIKQDVVSNLLLKSLTVSNGELDPEFNKNVYEYDVEVEDGIGVITINAEAEDSTATVSGTGIKSLNYGENNFAIVVTSKTGQVSSPTNIKVTRVKKVQSINLDKNAITLEKDETYNINYTVLPNDATNKAVRFVVADPTIASVDSTGKVSAINYGQTTVKVISEQDENVYATLNVRVFSKTITSDVYTINRYHGDELLNDYISDLEHAVYLGNKSSHIIGMEPETSIENFVKDLNNDSETLSIYDKDGNKITDITTSIATEMTIKLEVDDVVYDELKIVVRGDLNGDGMITMPDYSEVKAILLGNKPDFIKFLAAENDNDGVVGTSDYGNLKSYLLKITDSLNN